MNKAIITHVNRAGTANTTEVEHEELAYFYATVTGTIRGILMSGEQVTGLDFP